MPAPKTRPKTRPKTTLEKQITRMLESYKYLISDEIIEDILLEIETERMRRLDKGFIDAFYSVEDWLRENSEFGSPLLIRAIRN